MCSCCLLQYNASSEIKSLATLIETYHASVGRGGTLELNIDMDITGNPVPSRAARIHEFGAWIRTCYGSPVARSEGSWVVEIQLSQPTEIDRVVLVEDITFGQRVRSYQVSVTMGADVDVVSARDRRGSQRNVLIANGTAIGSKKIDVFAAAVVASTVTVTVTSAVDTPHLEIACYRPCSNGTV